MSDDDKYVATGDEPTETAKVVPMIDGVHALVRHRADLQPVIAQHDNMEDMQALANHRVCEVVINTTKRYTPEVFLQEWVRHCMKGASGKPKNPRFMPDLRPLDIVRITLPAKGPHEGARGETKSVTSVVESVHLAHFTASHLRNEEWIGGTYYPNADEGMVIDLLHRPSTLPLAK